MHLKKIGVENFRVFGEKTEFSFRPITVLTGKNSSGKSSLNKLLLLLKENSSFWDYLNLSGDNSNLYSTNNVISWGSTDEKFTLEFDFPMSFFDGKFTIEIEYTSKKNDELEFNVSNICIKRNNVDFLKSDGNYLDIDYIYQFYLAKCNEKKRPQKSKSNIPFTAKFTGAIPRNDSKFGYFSICESEIPDWGNPYEIDDELKKEKGALFTITKDEKPVPYYTFSELCQIEEKYFNQRFGEEGGEVLDYPEWVRNSPFDDVLQGLCIKMNEDNLFKKMEEVLGFKMKDCKEGYSKTYNFIVDKLLKENLKSTKRNVESQFSNIYYLSPKRGNQNRILSNNSDSSEIESIVSTFSKVFKENKNTEITKFINESLSLFGIEGELKVEKIENIASIVYLEIDNRKVSLADVGYGYAQLIPIILKIAIIASRHNVPGQHETYNETTLILEEPEANLHPDFQSKLANVIVTAGKLFNIQFIVETHSEYFIRKLQYLTAKKELLPEHSVIYYFTNPNEVKEREEQIRKINIKKDGALTRSFGKGFFDEATSIQLELYKINQVQKN